MNRGASDAVLIEEEWYTPIFMTIYGNALGDKEPKYKDVGEDDLGRVLIHGGGSSGDSTLWISIGRPLRQLKWLEKYAASGAPAPMVRSFLVPLAVADLLAGDAITESGSGGSEMTLNVDKHYERNQYGVKSPQAMELLRQWALPGSLRTYSEAGPTQQDPESWVMSGPAMNFASRPVCRRNGSLDSTCSSTLGSRSSPRRRSTRSRQRN